MEKPKPKSNRGGARHGAGRKAKDGATGMVVISASVTADQRERYRAAGGSVWLRAQINRIKR